jgi:hypothetical protein
MLWNKGGKSLILPHTVLNFFSSQASNNLLLDCISANIDGADQGFPSPQNHWLIILVSILKPLRKEMGLKSWLPAISSAMLPR